MLKMFAIEGIGILVVSQGLKWELGAVRAFIVAVLGC